MNLNALLGERKVKMNKMGMVAVYIQANLVISDWGEFGGIDDPTLEQLGALKVLIEAEIAKELANAAKDDGA